ncbi:hypothetical protein J5N97_025000 [Dioscorea zingiberensis]|uniref:Cystatin domain-containing protein n=1 Tax=Dioscorea zingiberensis TaxID=325984 RepID=A0A9D5C899_9LILI|nr:hypothetical protein J5N97_025000 [Dioscorea zingiberensis]
MAARIPLILLLLLAATALSTLSALDTDVIIIDSLSALDTDVIIKDCNEGGLTELENVGSNKLVQSLGMFAVETYNRNLQEKNKAPPTTLLSFSHVTAAQSQVVEGAMYYLKIVAEDYHHARKVFDAKVLEQLWLNSTELISFTPSAH